MKAQKLRDAKQLMDKRVQFLRDPAELRRETAQFPTDSGDLCSVIFDVTPLDGSTEVEDVVRAYTAASCYIKSMGTMMPPYTGDDAGVVHGRLQVDTSPEMPTESSFVVFSELKKPTFSSTGQADSEPSDECIEPLGMLVLDSVDEDELHPYRSDEFLREDVNAVVTISRGSRRQNGYKGNNPDKRVPCLVVTRWFLLCVPIRKVLPLLVQWTSCSKLALIWETKWFKPSRKQGLLRKLEILRLHAILGDLGSHQQLQAAVQMRLMFLVDNR
ncbi:unnamed protein product [Phytophthora fragariaefolia]|uniref:Unnamed protein product n=1 Tax=Phytophthora fragariaefolia TaxID=1490495 RepID=A0A9W7CX47_9STRA|nr:unnamed protein product [Phytophthora fragariaefolia]